MTHDNDHDFNQFRGAFDDAVKPDRAFMAKMEKLLQTETPATDSDRQPPVLASPKKPQSSTVIPTRRSHSLMVVVAVLTVFAVVITSVWVLSGDVLEGNYASAPGDTATMPANAPGMPAMDVNLEAVPVEGLEDAGNLYGIYDGVAIYLTQSNEDPSQGLIRESASAATPESIGMDQSLVAVDVQTGERLWELENTIANELFQSGDVIVASNFDIDGFGQVTAHELMGIRLHSGEIIWEETVQGDAEDRRNSAGNSVMGTENLIAIPGSDGVIRAWDKETGELAWANTFDPGTGVETEWMVGQNQIRTVEMVNFVGTVWNNHIVLVNGEGAVQVIGPENGKTVVSYNLLDASPEDFQTIGGFLQFYSLPSGVVIFRNVPDRDMQRTAATLFNPLTGEVTWTQQFEGNAGSPPSNSADGAMAINTSQWHQASWFLQIFGKAGYSTTQFFWIDGNSGQEILHTEPTTSTQYNFAVTDGEYACIRTDVSEVVCFNRAGTRHIINIQLESSMLLIDGVLFIPTQDGLFTVDLP